jgi:hypothetical protein
MRSVGAISWLNGSVGRAKGIPYRVVSNSDLESVDVDLLSSIGLSSPSGGESLICHETLKFVNGSSESGLISFYDPGGSAPMQVEWMSDTEVASRRAEADRIQHQEQAQRDAREQVPANCSSAHNEMLTQIPVALGLGTNAAQIVSVAIPANLPARRTSWGRALSCPVFVKWDNGLLQSEYFNMWDDQYGQIQVEYGDGMAGP